MGRIYKKITGILACILLGIIIFSSNIPAGAGQDIRLNQRNIALVPGKSKVLNLKGINNNNKKEILWKSQDIKVAPVDSNGRITARKEGWTTISANYKGKEYKCKVVVLSSSNASYGRNAVTPGTKKYRDFSVDNVLHSKNNGDIHYNVYFPDSYNGRKKHALFITLPGYQGLYFQGVAENIKTEDFGFEAGKYNKEMVILAPQLNDWQETSANQTIALVEYFISHYKINPSKVYINGYSGGGETLSLVLGKRPELFTAALMCSSQWDGKYSPVVKAKTPVYFVIGEKDEYYSPEPFKNSYKKLYGLYKKEGFKESEINKLLVLDVKDSSYFAGTGIIYQHGGGYLFCRDKEIMGWLFKN